MGKKHVNQFGVFRAIVFIALVSLLLPFQVVFGHAHVEKTVPQADAQTNTIPREVCIWFTEPAEQRFSQYVVKDASGKRVDDEKAQKQLRERLGVSNKIGIPLTTIGPGTYTVEWQVLSIDTHTSKGSFKFTVAEGATMSPALDENTMCGESLPSKK